MGRSGKVHNPGTMADMVWTVLVTLIVFGLLVVAVKLL